MYSISDNANYEKSLLSSISGFCKTFRVADALTKANAYKASGIPVIRVFTYLVQLVYTKKSMHMNILNDTNRAGFAKDVVYRFLNSSYINWSVFLLTLASNVINNKVNGLTSSDRKNALVVDDTLYTRSRSKHVELLARVYDHSGDNHKYRRGFRQLTIAWTDGVTLIPLLFRHLSSEKKDNRYKEISSGIDKRTCGYKTRLQAITPAPKIMVEMLKQIVKSGIPSKHVLFDTWFSFPSTIIEIAKLKLHTVARIKNSSKITYLTDDGKKTLSQIYSASRKRRGMSKYLLSAKVKLFNNSTEETIDARIVYVRDRKNKKNWIALISTDMSLTEEEIIQLYGKRWDIEVFFKISKSYLNLGKEFQGLSYDSITAHTAVVLTRYMMLALEKRQKEDPRSLGEIFFLNNDEITDIQFAEALSMLFELLRNILKESMWLTSEQIDHLVDTFILKLPDHIKQKLNKLPERMVS